jgi:transposase
LRQNVVSATAHHWARELTKLGHKVRLMPAKDVKAYVKRNKNDSADAEAICEAVRRPTMRFVQVKSAEQQGQLMQHRTRDLVMRQRTQVINALRAHLAELGIVAAKATRGSRDCSQSWRTKRIRACRSMPARASSCWRRSFRRCRR